MSKVLSILGSTGSIGTQTLDVAAQCGFRVAAITANRSVDRRRRAVFARSWWSPVIPPPLRS